MDKTSLGDRMKGYENVPRISLIRRMPVVLRVDGRSFHTLTKKADFNKPFCHRMHAAMSYAAATLAHEVQGFKLAYIQSDEISIVMTDYDTLQTDAWFGYGVQKMCSIAAAATSNAFNRYMLMTNQNLNHDWAQFDARVWNLPKEEVANYFVWRQQDATRNSIQMLGRAHFSHKELDRKNTSDIQDLLMAQGINWNDIPTWQKRGFCIRRGVGGIFPDDETPIFTKDREYIEDLIELPYQEADDLFAARTNSSQESEGVAISGETTKTR